MAKTFTQALETLRLSRRSFVVQSGIVTCGVAFGLSACQEKPRTAAKEVAGGVVLEPNPWVTLRSDGSIEIIAPGIELGQGSMSTLPRYVAEELDADWSRVRVIPAPSDEKTYGNPLFWGIQVTAGSRTCLGYFDVMRRAGAQARYVLLMTASRKWDVPISELATDSGHVLHQASQRRIAYAELVDAAEVPKEFPEFIAPDDRPQEPDDFFGEFPWTPAPQSATRPPPVKLKSWKSFKLLGVDAPRVDIPDKVSGAAKYGIDIEIPGMVHAMVETGPVAGATPEKIDDASARRSPGVVDVIALPYGVAVVANDITAAARARKHLKVSWKSAPQARAYDSDRVLEDFARIARDSKAHPGVRAFERGDTSQVLTALSAQPPVVFEARSELVYHAPIEPQNAVLRLSADGKTAEAWLSTQWPSLEQGFVSKVLGIAPESVTIHTPLVGGSFGRRQEPGAIVDAAYIAQKISKPVKVLWTREDDLKRNPHRQALVCRMEAAVGPDGKIRAMRSRIVGDSWFVRMFPDFFKQYNGTDPGNWVGARHLYDVPLQLIENVTERRSVDVCYLRGIGCTQTKFALESLIDEVATRSGKDPLAYRLEMLHKVPRATNVLRTVADMAQWQRKREGRALGIAYTGYGNGHAALVAEVSVKRASGEIRVHEVWSAVDVGFAVQPAIVASQIEGGILHGMSMALFEKVTYRDGASQESNFHDYRILRMSDTPQVNVKVLSTANAISGAGEIGVMQIAPAINNAVAKLIGARLSSMPMLPEQVLKTMRS